MQNIIDNNSMQSSININSLQSNISINPIHSSIGMCADACGMCISGTPTQNEAFAEDRRRRVDRNVAIANFETLY